MKNLLLFFFFSLFSFFGKSQNLVPNGSFENYTFCPQLNEVGNGQFERCIGWFYSQPAFVGSPDYFNVCNNFVGGGNQGVVGIPNNFWGHQEAFHGSAYVGLGAFEISTNNLEVLAKEYISVYLNEPLEQCSEYKISIRVSLANLSTHGAVSLGAKVSTGELIFNDLQSYQNIEADWNSNLIPCDTTEWILLEGYFSAKGGEDVLTIGHFESVDTTLLCFNDSTLTNSTGTFLPYFYVDSVSLNKVGEVSHCVYQLPNVFTPNNDQVNDIIDINQIGVESCVITNRWGNCVAYLDINNPIWDGTSGGKPCSEGVYFYKAIYKEEELAGTIQLVR